MDSRECRLLSLVATALPQRQTQTDQNTATHTPNKASHTRTQDSLVQRPYASL